MIKCSKNIKTVCLILSIILGLFIGFTTYDVAISQTLLKFRVMITIGTVLLVILSIIGNILLNKYNVNDELVLDDEMEDYFADLSKKFANNIVISSLIGVTLLVVTFVAEFHMPVMPYVCSLFYFVLLFIYVLPFVDEIIAIIRMAIEYHRANSGIY